MELLVAQIPTSDPNVLGDRIQLQQVIVNVLLNGIQAISHAGTDRRQIVVETSYGLDGVTC